jgi:hypothetical protein
MGQTESTTFNINVQEPTADAPAAETAEAEPGNDDSWDKAIYNGCIKCCTACWEGTAEQRNVAYYRRAVFPGLMKEIEAAAGFPLVVEVDWDAIIIKDEAKNCLEDGYWSDIYFRPLRDALKKITIDDMGREALKAGLQKVVVKYDKKAPSSDLRGGWPFEAGVLTINYKPWTNASKEFYKERVKAIQLNLEAKL